EDGGDEHRVVDFQVGGAAFTRARDVVGGDGLPAFCRLACDDEQRLQLVRDRRLFRIGLDLDDEVLVAAEMMCGDGAMNRLTVAALVLRGDVGRDELALGLRQAVWAAQEDIDELVERLRCFRPERHRAANTGQPFRKGDMWSGWLTRCGGHIPRWPCAAPSGRTPARRAA